MISLPPYFYYKQQIEKNTLFFYNIYVNIIFWPVFVSLAVLIQFMEILKLCYMLMNIKHIGEFSLALMK